MPTREERRKNRKHVLDALHDETGSSGGDAAAERVDRYRGVPPYYETQAYIARIIRDYNRQKLAENPALAKKPARKSPGAKPRAERQQTASR